MTVQVRQQVFETNSSSSHSLTLGKGQLASAPFSPEVMRNGVVVVPLYDYGWEWHRYYSPVSKLSYLASQVLNDKGSYIEANMDALREEFPYIDMLSRVVKEHTGCELKLYGRGSVDHQSAFGDAANGEELFESEEKLKAFIFDESAFIQTGNDNDEPPWMIPTDSAAGRIPVYADRFKEAPQEGHTTRTLRTPANNAGCRGLVTAKGGFVEQESSLMQQIAEHGVLLKGTSGTKHEQYTRSEDPRVSVLTKLCYAGLSDIGLVASFKANDVPVVDYDEEFAEVVVSVPTELAELLDALDPKGFQHAKLKHFQRMLDYYEKRIAESGKRDAWLVSKRDEIKAEVENLEKKLAGRQRKKT